MLLMSQENTEIKNVLNNLKEREISDLYDAKNFTGESFNPLTAKGTNKCKHIKVVSVDTGKFQTKALIFDILEETDENGVVVEKLVPRTITIESTMGGAETLDRLSSHEITMINGKKYSFAGGKSVANTQTKETEEHQAFTMKAIGDLVENGDVVDLVVGQPLNMFSNKEKRKQFETFMRFGVEYSGNGTDVVEVQIADGDGENIKRFYIREVMCAPETLSALMTLGSRKAEFEYTASLIADLGGRNAQFLPLLANLKPDPNATFKSYNLGSIMLADAITEKIKSHRQDDTFDKNIVLNALTYKMNMGHHDKRKSMEDIVKIIDDYIYKTYLPQIEECMVSEGLNDTKKIIFTGGTALLLKTYLEEYFRDYKEYEITFLTNPIFANCMGYATMGRKKLGKING